MHGLPLPRHRRRGYPAAMAHALFSPEWALALRDAINADERYREAAAKWEWPVALVVREGEGRAEPLAVELALRHGHCDEARVLPAADATAPFVLRGAEAAWRRVLAGDLDPIAGIMRKELELVRGSLATLLLHVKAAKALVEAARGVEIEGP